MARKLQSGFPADLLPMEARLVAELPLNSDWQFEPKWDGFRCLVIRQGSKVELRAKSGKPLARYFPEIVAEFESFKAQEFAVDGELLIPAGDTLSFDALLMRIHPAQSRIEKLARESPAVFMGFDMLMGRDGELALDKTLLVRRKKLEAFQKDAGGRGRLRLSPYTRSRTQAQQWLDKATGGALDGVIAKSLEGHYEPGERAMLKVKRLRTADCVVGGFRYASGSREAGLLLLGLFNAEGKLDHVGFTSGISQKERPELTRKLEKLRGGPGFSGKAPGGPSRWSNERSESWESLRTRLVVEVQFDQITAARFRHGTRLLRWRPDKDPAQCTFEQIAAVQMPVPFIARALRGRA
jgi:ATP-dependent DNA ligase